jgi:uncharacterized membrane protein YedE/YeeE
MKDRKPAYLAVALISGLVFGFGLSIARMTDPEKIKDFLDIAAIATGGWDPSLAFVMGAGVLVGLIGFRAELFIQRPLLGPSFIPTHRVHVDRQLIVGSAIFGVGWGLSGFCPGPSFAVLSLIPTAVLPFVVALLVGSWSAGQLMEWQSPTPSGSAGAPAR